MRVKACGAENGTLGLEICDFLLHPKCARGKHRASYEIFETRAISCLRDKRSNRAFFLKNTCYFKLQVYHATIKKVWVKVVLKRSLAHLERWICSPVALRNNLEN